MTDADDYTFDGCRNKLRDATRVIIDRETAYERAVERSSDAESVYRSAVGKAFQTYREDGKAVQEADVLAKRDVAVLSRERDYAAGLVKVEAERLEDARDSRRSLWRLIEWAREVAVVQARSRARSDGMPENAPAEQWP